MSTLEVKELSHPAGEVIKIAAGKTLDLKTQGSVTMPTGSVVQVVTHKTSSRVSAAVTGANAPVAGSGASYTTFNFTPKYSDSTLILSSSTIGVAANANVGDTIYTFVTDGTSILASQINYLSYHHWRDSLDSTFVSYNHPIPSWGTSQRTLDMRFGSGVSETISVNKPTNTTYDTVTSSLHEVCFSVTEIQG